MLSRLDFSDINKANNALRDFGLTNEEIALHSCTDSSTLSYTLEYLTKAREDGLDVHEAFKKIKGFKYYHLVALSKYGFFTIKEEAVYFLENIYGLKENTLKYLDKAKEKGYNVREAFTELTAYTGKDLKKLRFLNSAREEGERIFQLAIHTCIKYSNNDFGRHYTLVRLALREKIPADIVYWLDFTVDIYHKFHELSVNSSSVDIKEEEKKDFFTNTSSYIEFSEKRRKDFFTKISLYMEFSEEGKETLYNKFIQNKDLRNELQFVALEKYKLNMRQVRDHSLHDCDKAEAIFTYLDMMQPTLENLNESLQKIAGYNPQQIKFFAEYGLTKEQMEGHDLNNKKVCFATFVYVARCRSRGESLDVALQKIKGWSADQITFYNDNDVIPKEIKLNNSLVRPILNGVAKYFVADCVYSEFRKGNTVERFNKITTLLLSLRSVKKIARTEYNLSLDGIEAHSFDETHTMLYTFVYLEQMRKEEKNIPEEFNKIKGLNGYQIVFLMDYKLPTSCLEGHNVQDFFVRETTFLYLDLAKTKYPDSNYKDLFGEIKGLNLDQIKARIKELKILNIAATTELVIGSPHSLSDPTLGKQPGKDATLLLDS